MDKTKFIAFLLSKMRTQNDFGVKTTQGSFQEFKVCKYKTDKDLKCSIGHFIPDNKYEPDFEFQDPEIVLENFGEVQSSANFMKSVQSLHDSLAITEKFDYERFKTQLEVVSRIYQFDFPNDNLIDFYDDKDAEYFWTNE